MSALALEIVDRVIRHTRGLSTTDRYDWPTAREALTRILDDLETRAEGDPSVDRLRRFIAEREKAWADTKGQVESSD